MENLDDVISQVEGISKSIMEYGAFTVILAVFLVLFIAIILALILQSQKQVKQMMKNSEKQSQNMNNLSNELLEAVLGRDKKKEDKKDLVKKYIDCGIVFRDSCKTVQQRLEADRVAIYVFHNGNKSLHGLPFFKMSCVGEWVTYGKNVYSRGKSHTELPLHLFSSVIETLYNTGEFTTIGSSKLDKLTIEEMNMFFGNSKVDQIFVRGIYDEVDNLAGFTICEFAAHDLPSLDEIRASMNTLNETITSIIVDADIQTRLTDGETTQS